MPPPEKQMTPDERGKTNLLLESLGMNKQEVEKQMSQATSYPQLANLYNQAQRARHHGIKLSDIQGFDYDDLLTNVVNTQINPQIVQQFWPNVFQAQEERLARIENERREEERRIWRAKQKAKQKKLKNQMLVDKNLKRIKDEEDDDYQGSASKRLVFSTTINPSGQ
jgi:hypothetical protein